MKYVGLVLALFAFGAGLIAARYWYSASKVQIIPVWEESGVIEPVMPDQSNADWIVGLIATAQKAGRLNKIAAVWTAISVSLGTASAVAGAFLSAAS